MLTPKPLDYIQEYLCMGGTLTPEGLFTLSGCNSTGLKPDKLQCDI